MSNITLRMVHSFHEAFGIENAASPGVPDGHEQIDREALMTISHSMNLLSNALKSLGARNDGDTRVLRLQLIQEELAELAEGMAKGDIVECLDALCDLQYVVDGTTLALGLQGVFMEAFTEVHRSNMSKLGPDGRPIKNEAGRVVKAEGYEPPNLATLLGRVN